VNAQPRLWAVGVVVAAIVLACGCSGGASDDSAIDCPSFVPDPIDDEEHLGPEGAPSGLTADMQVLMAYGAAHEDAFGGARYQQYPEEVRLQVGLSKDIDEHCRALRELVEFPESLDVFRVPYSYDDLQAAAQAAKEVGAHPYEVGWRLRSPVKTMLAADAESIAARLHAEYGDALDLRVGGWPYPPPDIEGVPEVCDPIVESADQVPLEAEFVPLDGPISAAVPANEHHVTITVTNVGSEMIFVSAGLQTLPLFRPGEDTAAAFFTGFIEGWAAGGELEPGESREFWGAIGVTPCTLDNGYLLTPGVYELRGPLDYSHENQHYVMLVDPITVVVTE